MIFNLYSSCLVVDEEEEDAVDAVGGGPSVVSSVGPSEVFLPILERRFAVYTGPPRMGGHGTAVVGISSSCLMLWKMVPVEGLSSSSKITSMFNSDKFLYRFLTIVSSSTLSLS